MSYNKHKINNINEFEEGYLIGLFVGDGYSYYSPKDRHYRTDFFLNSINDIDIIEYLINLIKKLELNYFTMKDKRFNCMKVASNSKSFMEFINYGVKKFNEELILDKNTKLGFICGFIDAEGCTKMGSIIVCQKDKIVLEKFMKMCESLNISDLKLKQYKNTKTIHYIYRLRIPTRFKYMLLDSHKVKRMMK